MLTQELNIWRHWIDRKKVSSPLCKVPLMGLGAKLYFAEEWAGANVQQQREILSQLGVLVMNQLRDLKSGAASDPRATRASLSGLIDVLAAFQQSSATSKQECAKNSVDCYFSCSLGETLEAPQAAVVKLVVAEQLQEHCSLLLSERLAHEDEEASSLNGTSLGAEESKSANHTQRRRANRKKLLKKRRHEAEERLAQQKLLKTALDELKTFFRQKKEQTRKNVADILDGIVQRAAIEAKPKVSKAHAQANHTVVDLLDATSSASSKKKKKRKKAKKSDGDHPGADKSRAETSTFTHAKAESPATPTKDEPGDPEEKENRSHQQVSTTPAERPLLSFLDKSYSSPLSSMPTFGPEPLYTSSPASPPFFLSLPPPRDLRGNSQRNNSSRTDELIVNGERTSGESAGTSSSGGQEKSSESNFEWYLPSLFSSESSNHTNSTTSSLDWDFNNWQLKNEATSSTKNSSGILSTRANRATLRNPPQPPVPSSSKAYSLESFSNMLSVDAKRPRKPSSPGDARAAADEDSSADEGSPRDNGSLAMKSDFLYQQGGFFDRQRALKRRRRPLPFDYEDDECCNSGGEDDDTAWAEYPAAHCCGCRCQRTEAGESCDCKLTAEGSCQCSERKRTKDRKSPPSDKDSTLVPETPEMLERLTKLEAALDEKTKVSAMLLVFLCDLNTAFLTTLWIGNRHRHSTRFPRRCRKRWQHCSKQCRP